MPGYQKARVAPQEESLPMDGATHGPAGSIGDGVAASLLASQSLRGNTFMNALLPGRASRSDSPTNRVDHAVSAIGAQYGEDLSSVKVTR